MFATKLQGASLFFLFAATYRLCDVQEERTRAGGATVAPYASVPDCGHATVAAGTFSAPMRGLEPPPEVLFVCVHNAGRSQMAAGLLDHRSRGAVRVRSAGSAPASEINPAVVQVMAEIGIDVSRELPKRLTDEAVRAADVVITMGCGDACPVYLGTRYLDWELEDPAPNIRGRGRDAYARFYDAAAVDAARS